MININDDRNKMVKNGRTFIHLENLPGGVCAWAYGAFRPTFMLRCGQHVQLAQFDDNAAAEAYLHDHPAWEIVARVNGEEGR